MRPFIPIRGEEPMGHATIPQVKVRINASGKRLLGYLSLPQDIRRTSDLLNNEEPFLQVMSDSKDGTGTGHTLCAVAKHAITYVEALEEPSTERQQPRQGEFRSVVAELRGIETQVSAEVFVPEDGTLITVLNDPRPFVSMRNVQFSNSIEHYSFLAVAKKQLILVKP